MGGDLTIPQDVEQAYEPTLPTQQFGVTLQIIKDHYNVVIPPVVKQCVEYLDQPDGNAPFFCLLKSFVSLGFF